MAASVNGITLASLFYHHQSNPNNEEGFLFGKVVKEVEDTISDSEITNSQLQTTICITDFLPLNKDICIYGSNGTIDTGILHTLLQDKHQEVIGWYSCRRNTSPRVSMKESTIHRSLLSSLNPQHPHHFLLLLSTTSLTANLATHSFDHVIYRFQSSKFHRVKLSIINLGDTTHTQYKKQSLFSGSTSTDLLQSSVNQFRSNFESNNGEMLEVKNINQLSNCLHEQLVEITKLVKKSEYELNLLEKEVQELNTKVQDEEDKQIIDSHNNRHSPEPILVDLQSDTNQCSKSDQNQQYNSISTAVLSNAYSLKLEELDNQVLDLEGKGSSKGTRKKTRYDDSWLDISIDPMTSTGITTHTTLLKTTEHDLVTTTAKSSTQHRTLSKTKSAANSVETSSDTKDPFSFVESILSKETNSSSSMSVSVGQQIQMPSGQAEVSKKSVKSSTSGLERHTRQNKTQRVKEEQKHDNQTEHKQDRTRNQRAKTHTTNNQPTRSSSREGKQNVASSREGKQNVASSREGKQNVASSRESKQNVASPRDGKQNTVRKTQCKKETEDKICDNDSRGDTTTKKEDSYSITTDDEMLPSSSPVF